MDPYYSHTHTFGPVNEGAGVDRGMHQLYGKQKGLGNVAPTTLGTGLILGIVVTSFYVVPVVVNQLVASKVLGFDNRLNTKQQVARSSAVGALYGLGALAAYSVVSK
jgi:hypothetical protein